MWSIILKVIYRNVWKSLNILWKQTIENKSSAFTLVQWNFPFQFFAVTDIPIKLSLVLASSSLIIVYKFFLHPIRFYLTSYLFRCHKSRFNIVSAIDILTLAGVDNQILFNLKKYWKTNIVLCILWWMRQKNWLIKFLTPQNNSHYRDWITTFHSPCIQRLVNIKIQTHLLSDCLTFDDIFEWWLHK